MYAIVFLLNVLASTHEQTILTVPLDAETTTDDIRNSINRMTQAENNSMTGNRLQHLSQHDDLSTIKRFKSFIIKHAMLLQIISLMISIFIAFCVLILYDAEWYQFIEMLTINILVFMVVNGYDLKTLFTTIWKFIKKD